MRVRVKGKRSAIGPLVRRGDTVRHSGRAWPALGPACKLIPLRFEPSKPCA